MTNWITAKTTSWTPDEPVYDVYKWWEFQREIADRDELTISERIHLRRQEVCDKFTQTLDNMSKKSYKKQCIVVLEWLQDKYRGQNFQIHEDTKSKLDKLFEVFPNFPDGQNLYGWDILPLELKIDDNWGIEFLYVLEKDQEQDFWPEEYDRIYFSKEELTFLALTYNLNHRKFRER